MIKFLGDFTPFIVIIFVLILLVILFIALKDKHVSVSKSYLVKNNEFIAKNKEKLAKIFDDKYKELDPLKNRILYASILLGIVIIASILIKSRPFAFISIGVSLFLLIKFWWDYNSKSDKKFTEIAKEVIHDFDKNLNYKPSVGFSRNEYNLCRFPEDCDRFHSEDMIDNAKNGFQFADVLVESKYTDKDGNTHYSVEFQGSLAKMYIKNMNCKIYLGGMRTSLFFDSEKASRIKFENDEFNDLFMAYADNELLAYKVLTPDVMEEFVNIKKNSFGDVDIRILNDKLYVRFLSGNGFDSSSFKKDVDKDNLCQSIAVLEEVMRTMEKVKKIIENKNMD